MKNHAILELEQLIFSKKCLNPAPKNKTKS